MRISSGWVYASAVFPALPELSSWGARGAGPILPRGAFPLGKRQLAGETQGFSRIVEHSFSLVLLPQVSSLLVGPVFQREAVTAPRRPRHFVARTTYVATLWVLVCTAWLVMTGTQEIRNVGDFARFGATLFPVLAYLQFTIVLFFSALATASAVAHEKDRRTLILLLMTRLSNSELVLGKMFASLLNTLVLLAAAFPLFMLCMLFGGVAPAQVLRVFAVTLMTALAAGSLGSVIALWRDKTFQAVALTSLIMVLWMAAWWVVGVFGGDAWHNIAIMMNPAMAVDAAAQPHISTSAFVLLDPVNGFLLFSVGVFLLLNGLAIWRVRIWNPSREIQPQQRKEDDSRAKLDAAESVHDDVRRKSRQVWDNPLMWREICTWAYGRKVLLIRSVYWVLAALSFVAVYSLHTPGAVGGTISQVDGTLAVAPLFVLSLVLVNAQAVTSLTSERDAKALDILLVTDLKPTEFIFGKLGGVFYNVKEIVLLPLALCVFLWYLGAIGLESLIFLILGLIVMNIFVAVLGLHSGMIYINSRTAIAVSLGSVFFLAVGVATCLRIMIAFGGSSGSFMVQLIPFSAFMAGGGIALFVAWGYRNPSPAITLASLLCPFATFYAITSFTLESTMGAFLVVVFTYGFAAVAMLIPALSEFDVAIGKNTTAED